MTGRSLLTAAAFAAGLSFVGISSAAAQGIEHFAVLQGGVEVDATTGDADDGDTDGYGSATVIMTPTGLCYALVVHMIAPPTLAHIHEARAGNNGGVVVDFIAPTATPGATGFSSSECVDVNDAALRGRLRTQPHRFYVNVHNTPFGGGALRGQLH